MLEAIVQVWRIRQVGASESSSSCLTLGYYASYSQGILDKCPRTLSTLSLQQPEIIMTTVSVMPTTAQTMGSATTVGVVSNLAPFSDPSNFLDTPSEEG